jgi:hypothetical protein
MSPFSGDYAVPAGKMTHARLFFFIPVANKKYHGSFRADVALVDQFGNKHWLRNLEFIEMS